MRLFLDQILNGVGVGVIYASVALALVLIYRTTELINFAQGEIALFSTFITWWIAVEQGVPIGWAILLSTAIGFVGGALIERILIRPVEGGHSPLNIVIVTIGLFLAVNALARGELALGIRNSTAVFGAVLVAECVLLWLLLQKTRLGLRLRAVASNTESSRLMGINTGTVLMVGWGLAAAIGAVAGSLAAMRGSGFDTGLMQQTLVFAFAAAALGGFDSPLGAVVGGISVGVANALTVQYVDALDGIELVVPFLLILVVLMVKPNGLFGRTIVERV
jgi:branched-chain amino acid transport system permease protein